MGWLFTLLVVVAASVWIARRRGRSRDDFPSEASGEGRTQAGFRVVFRDGRRVEVEGRIPRNVLHAFEDIAAHADLSGEVRLTEGVDLRFSESIPPPVRQQLRNAYIAGVNVH